MSWSEFNIQVKQHIESKNIPAFGGILLEKSGKQLYNEAFGTVNLGDDKAPPFTNDTQLFLFSCSKLITGICALQLVEQGLLSLEDPVSKHFPQVTSLKIATELDGDGQPITRTPEKEIKIVHLFTHTSGITYDMFGGDEFMHAYRKSKGQVPGSGINPSAEWQYLDLFLDTEPGTHCRYGQNYEILGFVVESISGLPIEDYVTKNVAKPLGMTNTGALFTSDGRMVLHIRTPGGLMPLPDALPAETCWKRGGGHFLISSLSDYSQILLTLVNEGTHPTTGHKLLKAETVSQYIFQDWLPSVGVTSNGFGKFGVSLNSGIVVVPGDVLGHLALEDKDRGHSCGLTINKSSKPGYRSEGSGAWAGVANVYYWIDPKKGKAGVVGTSLIPFLDGDMLDLFEKFEKLGYSL